MRLLEKLPLILILVCVFITSAPAHLAAETTAETRAGQFAAQDTTSYVLPREKMRKAVEITRIWHVYAPVETVWSLVQLLLLLQLGIAARMSSFAVAFSRYRVVQAYVFVFLGLLFLSLLDLPLDIFRHHLGLAYGLSVQGWGSWFGDQAKSFGLAWAVGGMLISVLFSVIRRSPTRWWLRFGLVAVALTIAGVFLKPYVIDPMFDTFEPLAKFDPALVDRLEQVVARGGISIAPERMFLMKASAKVTTLNAYVTGFGASKRVVVWDTTLAKGTPDEISFIFAHEVGHYALHHIVLGVAFSSCLMLISFWIGYHGMRILIARFGAAWRIPSQNDWAAVVVLALVLLVLVDLTQPIGNGFSRLIEHNADVYGQEAVHGIVADPRAVAQQAFQVLGEDSLDDPTPYPLIEFWTFDHPPIRTRAAFARAYDPWAPGMHPKYFSK